MHGKVHERNEWMEALEVEEVEGRKGSGREGLWWPGLSYGRYRWPPREISLTRNGGKEGDGR